MAGDVRSGGACVASGACVAGWVRGRGACIAGVCVAGETATAAGSTHPTWMHSCYPNYLKTTAKCHFLGNLEWSHKCGCNQISVVI